MPLITLNVEVTQEQFDQIEAIRTDRGDDWTPAQFYGLLLAYGAFKYSQEDSGTPLK